MPTQEEAKRMFVELCKEFNARAAQIDKDTPWSDVEPDWWLDMSNIQRLTLEAEKKYAPSYDHS